MPQTFANPPFIDGDWSQPKSSGFPEFEAPIPGVPAEYLFTQKWQISRNALDANPGAFPTPLNTPHPIYTKYVLVEEGPRRGIGGAFVETIRKYAQPPATHFDWNMFGYNFIGMTVAIPPGANNPTLATRPRRSWTVKSRIQYDYFLVPVTGGPPNNYTDPITGAQVAIKTPGDIPDILDMQYCFQNTVGGALLGGILLETDSLNLAASALPTVPSSEQYQAMLSDALQNGWNATTSIIKLFPTSTLSGGPPPNAGHMAGTIDTANSVFGGIIPVEPSRVDRWMGNIYQRATRYVLAR